MKESSPVVMCCMFMIWWIVSEEAALAGTYAAEYVRTGQAFRESHSHGRQEV